jgi:chemosensory pili system protein ChpC
MSESINEIRGLMIAVTEARVLLPNANVSEIITAATPEPIAQAPHWVLGQVRWRGWAVPLFSFPILAGLAQRETAMNSKVIILKALNKHPKLPYIAMTCVGFPRLTTITPDILVPLETGNSLLPGVRQQVMVRDQSVYIPDLGMIEENISTMLQEQTNKA